MSKTKDYIVKAFRLLLLPMFQSVFSEPFFRKGKDEAFFLDKIRRYNSIIGKNVSCNYPYYFESVKIGDYSYIGKNASISLTEIGKFCSIGPNLFCGWGIHPTNGISTSPVFYSTKKQAGITYSNEDKFIERKRILIGDDVFIGANVTILDGVTIGNGAVIGAGAVVTQDIPHYAIAAGVPAHVLKFRFDDNTIKKLLEIKWWDFEENKLNEVEKFFYDVETFIKIHSEGTQII